MKYGRLVEEVTGEAGVASFVAAPNKGNKGSAPAPAKPKVTKISSGEYDRIVNWMMSFFATY
jgi:hypothetical protein